MNILYYIYVLLNMGTSLDSPSGMPAVQLRIKFSLSLSLSLSLYCIADILLWQSLSKVPQIN